MHKVGQGFKIIRKVPIISLLLLFSFNFVAGQTTRDPIPSVLTLSRCRSFALVNQSLVKQSIVDENITEKEIRIALSGWFPQLEFNANLQHYFQFPLTYYPNLINPGAPGIPYSSTSANVSSGIFSASQTLYSNNLLFAARTSKELRNQALQNTENSRINNYVDVTKAVFDVLLTEEHIKVLNEDILRLQRNYKDAYNLYKNGLTDKIDYQRTQISLSNAQAQRKTTEEALKAKYSQLKQLMGYSSENPLTVSFDSSNYENETLIDTTMSRSYCF